MSGLDFYCMRLEILRFSCNFARNIITKEMITCLKEIIRKEVEAIQCIPLTIAYEQAVDLIIEQVHNKKGKLITSGMGKAGQIASNIFTSADYSKRHHGGYLGAVSRMQSQK